MYFIKNGFMQTRVAYGKGPILPLYLFSAYRLQYSGPSIVRPSMGPWKCLMLQVVLPASIACKIIL